MTDERPLDTNADAWRAHLKRERAAAISNGDGDRAVDLQSQLAGLEPGSDRPARSQAITRPRGKRAQKRA